MSLVKCPECLHLCFSDSQVCQKCSREFSRGELRTKLAAENRAFDRKCYGAFLILFLLALLAVRYTVFHVPVIPPTPDSPTMSLGQ